MIFLHSLAEIRTIPKHIHGKVTAEPDPAIVQQIPFRPARMKLQARPDQDLAQSPRTIDRKRIDPARRFLWWTRDWIAKPGLDSDFKQTEPSASHPRNATGDIGGALGAGFGVQVGNAPDLKRGGEKQVLQMVRVVHVQHAHDQGHASESQTGEHTSYGRPSGSLRSVMPSRDE